MDPGIIFGGGIIIWAFLFILGICLAIAPLIIWRNTNRTNRMLAALLIKEGMSSKKVYQIFYGNDSAFKDYSDQKKCPVCNASAHVSSAACKECGHAYDVSPKRLSCPDCGHDITHMPENCPECGKTFKYKTK